MEIERGYKYYFKRYVVVGLPILLTSLSPILVALTDNMMVGSLGKEVRAATSYANALIAPSFVLMIGVSSVLMPLVAGARVQNNYNKATRWLKYGLFVNILCGITCVLALFILEYFLDYMGQDATTIALVRGGYFQIITTSILLNSVSQPLKRYLDGLGFSFVNTMLSFTSTGMNVCLNYLLIHGNFGFPAWGMNGAAIATFFSRLFSLFSYLVIVWLLKQKKYITSFSLIKWDMKYLKKMLRLGLPSGFEFAMKLIYLAVIRSIIGYIGVEEQAASAIIFDTMRLGLMLPVAMGTAGSILLAEEWRKGNKQAIWKVRKAAYFLNIGLMCGIAMALYFLFPLVLQYWFKPKEEVRNLILPLITTVLLFQILDGLTFIGTGLLRGIRDTFVPFLTTTFFSFLVGLPLSYAFAFTMDRGLEGIFQGMMVGLACATLILYVRFSYRAKVLLKDSSSIV